MKFYFLIVFSISFLSGVVGQWEPMDGPYGGYINDLEKNDNFQFAATTNGLYRSQNEGRSWEHIFFDSEKKYSCLQIGVWNSSIIADVVNYSNEEYTRFFFRSDDNGSTWYKLNRPSIDGVISIALNEFNIYIADVDNLWVSLDQGVSWKHSTITKNWLPFLHLYTYDNDIYLGGFKSVYKLSQAGDNFEEITIDIAQGYVSNFYISNELFLIAGSGKLIRSDNHGNSWTMINVGSNEYSNITVSGDSYFINTYTSILKSSDSGLTWTDQHSYNYSTLNYLMIGTENSIIMGGEYRGIYISKDSGKSFYESNYGISATFIQSVCIKDQTLFTGCLYEGIASCDLENLTWDSSFLFKTEQFLPDIAVYSKNLLTITDIPNKIYKSSDDGITWQNTISINDHPTIERFYSYNESILAGGTPGNSLWISENEGSNWEPYDIQVGGDHIYEAYLFAQNGSSLFVATRKRLFRSLDNGMTWDTAMNGLILENQFSSFQQLYNFNGTLIATELNDSTYNSFSKLHVSYDNGENWELTGNDLPVNSVQTGILNLTSVNNILIACFSESPEGIFVSFDNAHTWKPFREGLTWVGIAEITADNKYLYAATSGQGVWRRKISDLYTTSTQPISQSNGISIFPNPSNGSFTLKLNEAFIGNAIVVISDINGRVFMNSALDLKSQTVINTENLEPGFYLVTVQTKDKVYTSKIIIQE